MFKMIGFGMLGEGVAGVELVEPLQGGSTEFYTPNAVETSTMFYASSTVLQGANGSEDTFSAAPLKAGLALAYR